MQAQESESTFFRSDSISHYNLILPRESAWDIMNKLGQANIIHIVKTQNPILSKPFFHQVKRCDQALLKLSVVEKVLLQKNICTENQYLNKENWQEDFQQLYQVWEKQSTEAMKNPISMLDQFEEKVNNISSYYYDLNQRMKNLKERIDFNRENMAIIRGGEKNYGRGFFTNSQQRIDELGQVFMKDISKVSFKSGVLDGSEEMRFKKTVFRITKGNCLIHTIHFDDIYESLQESEKTKMVFFILFPSKEDGYLDKKLTKLVNTYCQKKYQLPTKMQQFEPLVKNLQDSYIEAEKLLSLTESQIDQYLTVIASPSKQIRTFKAFQYIKLYILKQKSLYQNLNEMQLFNNFLKGQIYIRKQDVSSLHRMLQAIQKVMKIPSGQIIATETKKYPTYFYKNSFTASAQQITETYGIPRYKEANPAFFAVVTFPFLFGVMFGDIAHGSILFAFGVMLCFTNRNNVDNLILKIFLPHRYLITMMGFFAVYCGFIYNDFLSISLDLFGTCYDVENAVSNQNIARFSTECVYPMGVDPVWGIASNSLNYLNSLKMKLAVIIAIVHMTLGVFVKASNALYYGKYMDFFCEFLPQVLFMTSLFAYMDFLIVYKWWIPWTQTTVSAAPSIITTMINIPLKLGKTTDCCGGQPLWGTYGDTSQDTIQLILLLIAVICIPWMLLPKPLTEIYCKPHPVKKASSNKSDQKQSKSLISSQQSFHADRRQNCIGSASVQVAVADEEQHDASQIFVHQMIETIEYVLGCISNTASYLRLWALSLAHSQLSEVFLEKTLEKGIEANYSGIPKMVILFPVFAGITFSVLLCMDSMQCFLHTLRLHWVQFQNKFYKGDGFIYTEYGFTKQISGSGKSAI